MIIGTALTLPIFYLLERVTGAHGAGFASPILAKALGLRIRMSGGLDIKYGINSAFYTRYDFAFDF